MLPPLLSSYFLVYSIYRVNDELTVKYYIFYTIKEEDNESIN
jgi:hypothetical protein